MKIQKIKKILAIMLLILATSWQALAQVVGTPYIMAGLPPVAPTSVKIYCDFDFDYNGTDVVSGVNLSTQTITMKVYNGGASAITSGTIEATGGGMTFRWTAGSTSISSLTPDEYGNINIPSGYQLPNGDDYYVVLAADNTTSPTVPAGTEQPMTFTVTGIANFEVTNTNCSVVPVQDYGVITLIFADNSGAFDLASWGPNNGWAMGSASYRSRAILGDTWGGQQYYTGSVNFGPGAIVDLAYIKPYTGAAVSNGGYNVSVGNNISGNVTENGAKMMHRAVFGEEGYDKPNIIIHAREGMNNSSWRSTLLQAYLQHVRQGGWLIFLTKEYNNYENYETLLTYLGVQHATITGTNNVDRESTDNALVPAATSTNSLVDAAAIVNGPFGISTLYGTHNNENGVIVRGLDPSYTEVIIPATSSNGTPGAYAFVCKKSDWKGGLIWLGQGNRGSFTSALYTENGGYHTYGLTTGAVGNDGAKLEMNALAYAIKQSVLSDLNK
jgi:hypothetical protein